MFQPQACGSSLAQGEAEELHAEVKTVIKKIHPLDQTLLGKNRRPSMS